MATLADLLALKPTKVYGTGGMSLADAMGNDWLGKGTALPPEYADWRPALPGKRGLTDMLAAMLPLEQNSAGERRIGVPGAVQALPQMPQAIADMIQRGVTGDYQPSVEDPTTGRMYDPRQYEDASNLAALIMTGALPIPAPLNSLRAGSGDLWHLISDTKLRKPLSEMDHASMEGGVPLNSSMPLNYEDLLGQKLVGVVGDLSSAGRSITRIDGTDLSAPVVTEGGKDFMRAQRPGEVWANAGGAASTIQNRINQAGADGSKVNLVFTTMGHPAIDSSTMMGDALARMMEQARVPKKAVTLFDKEIRAKFPDFVGVSSPKLDEYLRSAPGAERNEIVKAMAKKEFADLGFPDIPALRHALISPDLLGTPSLMSGAAISRVKPGADVIRNPSLQHPTYDTHIAGEYAGSAPMVPYNLMFPDWYAERMAGNAGLKPGVILNRDGRALMMSPPTQIANQQWLDNIMAYLATRKP